MLKIDVDGPDLKVVKGFEGSLRDASVIQIESVFSKIPETIQLLGAGGFRLVSICDIMYYGPSIYQCDLIFLRDNLINIEIVPNIGEFDGDLWRNQCI